MQLYFEPGPFYNQSYETSLPASLEQVQDHFKTFYAEYQKLSILLDDMFTRSNENTMLFFAGQEIKHKINTADYWVKHAEFQKLKTYYQHLLNAVRLKFNFWLNDLIPQPAKPKRRSRNKAK